MRWVVTSVGKVSMRPIRRFGLVTSGLAIAMAGAVWWYLGNGPLLPWLVAIDLVTFLTFGYDKLIAGTRRMRVPEAVLLGLAFVGGTVGAIAAMALFRHKTLKTGFRRRLYAVVRVQVLLALAYLLVLAPRLRGAVALTLAVASTL